MVHYQQMTNEFFRSILVNSSNLGQKCEFIEYFGKYRNSRLC
jgi:hypothetical protein